MKQWEEKKKDHVQVALTLIIQLIVRLIITQKKGHMITCLRDEKMNAYTHIGIY